MSGLGLTSPVPPGIAATPAPVHDVNPEARTLPPSSYRSSNSKTGWTLRFERGGKPSDRKSFTFRITVVFRDGSSTSTPHTLYVTDLDEPHGGSSLGYGDINLRDLKIDLSGKGIGYNYHYVAALAARELGVDYFVVDSVDSVATPASGSFCEGSNMRPSGAGYRATPEEIL